MKSLKLIVAGAAALALAACEPTKYIRTTDSGNTSARAGLIAVIDGCNLWQIDISNVGSYVYMTICPGKSAQQTQWTEGCGKNCTRTVFNLPANKEDGQ